MTAWMQLMPRYHRVRWTSRGYTFDDMYDIDANIHVAKAIHDAQGLSAWRNCSRRVGVG